MFHPMQMLRNNPMIQNNPVMQMVGMLQNSKSPMAVMQKMAGQNPQLQKVMQLANGKNPMQLQQMAENLAKEKGIDLQEFMKQMGINRP